MDSELHVLVVEDDALVRMATEDLITDAGFAVESASSGTEAIKKIESDVARYSSVVTDVRLGQGPTGWDVARRARELRPGIPVVYVSGDSARDWSANGVPGSIMLSKPFAQAQLVTALSMLLNEPHLQEGGDPA